MAPEVVLRKLTTIRRLLRDLQRHETASIDDVRASHYEIERILELLATASADLLQHLLAERGEIASSYRDVFRMSGEADLLPRELASRLEEAAGMRNVLVHLYDEIDVGILHASIGKALRDYPQLVAALARFGEADRET